MTLGALKAARDAGVHIPDQPRACRCRRSLLGRVREPADHVARATGRRDGARGASACWSRVSTATPPTRGSHSLHGARRSCIVRVPGRPVRPQSTAEEISMATVAVMTVSDGRDYVHREIEFFGLTVQRRIVDALTQSRPPGRHCSPATFTRTPRVEFVAEVGRSPTRPDDRQRSGLGVPALHHARRARDIGPGRCCSPTSIRSTPAWSGCSRPEAGSIRSGARTNERGATSMTPRCCAELDALVRAGAAANCLKGSHVRADRRPADGHVHRGVQPPRSGCQKFGIDVEEIDQYELVHRAPSVPDGEGPVRHASGSSEQAAKVHYDGVRLTPELLERQIRVYYVDAGADRRMVASTSAASRASPR